jgi:hypothetical protein
VESQELQPIAESEKLSEKEHLPMANTGKIIALHNNDIVFLAWQYEEAIPD